MGDTKGVPQKIEGITEVKWMKLPVEKEVEAKSFGSIKIVLNAFSDLVK